MNGENNGAAGLIVGTYAAGKLKKDDTGETFKSPAEKVLKENRNQEETINGIDRALFIIEIISTSMMVVFVMGLSSLLYYVGEEYLKAIVFIEIAPSTGKSVMFLYFTSSIIFCLSLLKDVLRHQSESGKERK